MLMRNMLKTDAFLRKTLERRMTGEFFVVPKSKINKKKVKRTKKG